MSLGIIGIFIPLLPTTPLLLLAAACFIKSSQKLYNWLIHHKYLGIFIKNYIEHRAVSRTTKIMTLIFLWITIGLSAFFIVEKMWIRILLLLIASGVSTHVLLLKTFNQQE